MKTIKKINILLFITMLVFGYKDNNKKQSDNSKIDSTTEKQHINNKETTLKEKVEIVYAKEIYDKHSKTNIKVPTLNKKFLKTVKGGIKAIIGYYGAVAETGCEWENGKPNKDYSNIVCVKLLQL